MERGHKNVMYIIYYGSWLQIKGEKNTVTPLHNNILLGLLRKIELSIFFLEIYLNFFLVTCKINLTVSRIDHGF